MESLIAADILKFITEESVKLSPTEKADNPNAIVVEDGTLERIQPGTSLLEYLDDTELRCLSYAIYKAYGFNLPLENWRSQLLVGATTDAYGHEYNSLNCILAELNHKRGAPVTLPSGHVVTSIAA